MKKGEFVFERPLYVGRVLEAYEQMFNFIPHAWKGRKVLDCASGSASFVAEARRLGVQAVGCDPMYGRPPEVLYREIDADIWRAREALMYCDHMFYSSGGINTRVNGYVEFLEDYRQARDRYVGGKLPQMPFADGAFDLALIANLLFLYGEHADGGMMHQSPFDYTFHLNAMLELCRVSREEVRIYPLKGPHSVGVHRFLQPLMDDLQKRNIRAEVFPVPFRCIKGAEHMLRLTPPRGQLVFVPESFSR